MRNRILVVLAVAALSFGPGVQALDSLAWSADHFGVDHPLSNGQVRNIADRSIWSWGHDNNAPQVQYIRPTDENPDPAQPSLEPYMLWNTPQDIRVLRLFADWNWGGWITNICVDTLAPGCDVNDPNSWVWVERYDSSDFGALAQVLVHGVDLGQAYTTAGLRVRVTYGTPPGGDNRRSLGEMDVFGDIGGTLESQQVKPSSTGWLASSNIGGAGASGLDSLGQYRWLSQSIAANIDAGHDFFFVDRTFSTPEDINLLSIAWRANSDNGDRAIPSYWVVQYQTEDSQGWLNAGTFYSELNINGAVSKWYYNDLGDLTGVTGLRIMVPYDAMPTVWDGDLEAFVPVSSNGIGIHLTETFNIHPIPEPATMSLLALGGLALLRRRR
ncbi:MAG: PEP-CTERM sorting domain-containing protein [Phycisphaerae bacterium]|nr:PEP-CTERM sorting domain-containing protein [Phycisphaerae bacterium]